MGPITAVDSPDSGEQPPVFAPVARGQRLSDNVAGQLLEAITGGRLPAGSRLPSERELGEQFGVSRTVIREAVRSLSAKGVIEVRSGRGVRVATVAASHVSEEMSLFLRGQGPIDYAKIHEVRMALEIRAARLAAERASAEDIDELRMHCERMAAAARDVEQASIADLEFHRVIARASHNELFLVMIDSIGNVLLEIRRATLGVSGRLLTGVEFHRRILAQIEAHDPEAAAEAMREHLLDACRAWDGLPAGRRAATKAV